MIYTIKDIMDNKDIFKNLKCIYVAHPTSSKLRNIRKEDLSSAKVNKNMVKFGKANDFYERAKDYADDQEGDVEFMVFSSEDPKNHEMVIRRNDVFKSKRVMNPVGLRDNGKERKRPGATEWIVGDFKEAMKIIEEVKSLNMVVC
jgi:hypothetical protein